MIFNSIEYFLFLPIVFFSIGLSLTKTPKRKILLFYYHHIFSMGGGILDF